MSENGEIYNAGKNFTLPLAVTALTNSISALSVVCRKDKRHAKLAKIRCTIWSPFVYITLDATFLSCLLGKERHFVDNNTQ